MTDKRYLMLKVSHMMTTGKYGLRIILFLFQALEKKEIFNNTLKQCIRINLFNQIMIC